MQAGDSGDGSYGRLADFKAEIINGFVDKHRVQEIVEFGCGDGAQLMKMNYPKYTGVDVSPTIVRQCKELFKGNGSKVFLHLDDPGVQNIRAELALSLDVIYHLIEDEVFDEYMATLFTSSTKWIIIYSSNFDGTTDLAHVRHRKFSAWVEKNAHDWEFFQKIDQRFPYKPNREEDTSFAEFYVYRLKA